MYGFCGDVGAVNPVDGSNILLDLPKNKKVSFNFMIIISQIFYKNQNK